MMASKLGAAPVGPRQDPHARTRTVFFVSDGTGITAETFGNSILNQFPAKPRHVRRPFIDTARQGRTRAARDQRTRQRSRARSPSCSSRWSTTTCATSSPARPARAWCWTCSAPSSSRWKAGVRRQEQPPRGPLHGDVSKSQEYTDRIEAINFSLAHDDGQSARNLEHADVILLGVEPQRQDAHQPVPGDAARHQGRQLPADPGRLRARQDATGAAAAQEEVLRPDDRPRPLSQIRNERRPGSKYAAIENCRYEVNEAEKMMRREGVAGCRPRTRASKRSRPRSCATCGRTG